MYTRMKWLILKAEKDTRSVWSTVWSKHQRRFSTIKVLYRIQRNTSILDKKVLEPPFILMYFFSEYEGKYNQRLAEEFYYLLVTTTDIWGRNKYTCLQISFYNVYITYTYAIWLIPKILPNYPVM